MKNKILYGALLSALLLLSGCDSDLMSSVKNAEYSDDLTIGDIFNETNYCTSVEWSEVENKKYGKTVKVVCEVDTKNYAAWGDKLIFNFKNVSEEIEFYNTYWASKEEKLKGGSVLSIDQSYLIVESILIKNI